MIKNARQYRIIKSEALRFRDVLEHYPETSGNPDIHPALWKVHENALRSKLADFEEDLAEYEAFQCGRRDRISVTSFDELPLALIQARIALGLTQKELAARLGVKEQQVQRYEATEYASASLTRVRDVIRALGLRVGGEVVLPDEVADSAQEA